MGFVTEKSAKFSRAVMLITKKKTSRSEAKSSKRHTLDFVLEEERNSQAIGNVENHQQGDAAGSIQQPLEVKVNQQQVNLENSKSLIHWEIKVGRCATESSSTPLNVMACLWRI